MKRHFFYAFFIVYSIKRSSLLLRRIISGGEIEFQQIGPTELDAWIVTYTKAL